MKRHKISKTLMLEVVYFAIAITTFRHTSWAAATSFEGAKPVTSGAVSWWTTGVLMAIAIDIGMFIVSWVLIEAQEDDDVTIFIIAFATLATSSFYMQLFYAVSNADVTTFGNGVTLDWQKKLRPIIDARVVIIPAMLPLFATIYTFAALRQKKTEKEHESSAIFIEPQVIDVEPLIEQQLALPDSIEDKIRLINDDELGFVCEICGKRGTGYQTEGTRSAAIKIHVSQMHREFATWRNDR